jgi:hypothetical protein
VEVTPLGNIVAFKQGEKRPVRKADALRAHGRGGLRHHEHHGKRLLKFDDCRQYPPGGALRPCRVVNGAVPGVICAKPMHLLKGEEREKPVPVAQLSIDIGADTREQAETAVVQIGDNACFVPFFESCTARSGRSRSMTAWAALR